MNATVERTLHLPLPVTVGDTHAFRAIIHNLLHRGGNALDISMEHQDVERITTQADQFFSADAAKRLLGSASFPQFDRHWATADELWFALAPTEHAALMLVAAAIASEPALASLLHEGRLVYELQPQHDLSFNIRLSWPSVSTILLDD